MRVEMYRPIASTPLNTKKSRNNDGSKYMIGNAISGAMTKESGEVLRKKLKTSASSSVSHLKK